MKSGSTPLVSVIVPSYNYEHYIKEALNSILEQTYDELELVIVDDNSKDNSCRIVEELISTQAYLEKFRSRIKFIRHDHNQGAHNSINQGIRSSHGDYVTILNADDLFQSNRIEEMIGQMLRGDAEFAFSKIKVIDANGGNISSTSDQAKNFIHTQESILNFPSVGWSLIPHNTAISTGNMVFSRKIFEKLHGFRNLKYCHDWDFILRSVILTEPIYVENTFYSYRLHGNNTFLSLSDVVDKEVKTVLGSYFKLCRKTNVPNKLAPSPNNWPKQFFEVLKNSHIIKFWYYSKSFSNFILQFRQNQLDNKDRNTNKNIC
ncbi:glycosyltransferase [Paenibacillus sp. P96]|uniref:Glycosyltransferase n=1 Tax=Paenibacillus zeirhizosphaerae TaxID=2987519 RepID=A0ABT9FP55_9BACL|nr:glycosyltransferase family 2 protein [Paenibacillus sp. P96]MDP4096512.1 glycosyltransferase [Paenibacillus sp. P96]